MNLTALDWSIVAVFFVITLTIGIITSRKAGKSSKEFFLSGRNMPWWLLGVSMVATTFSADTPNLVTDIVRQQGVSGNWQWWAFLLTGMLTVFIYAKLWRRSGVLTDLEFYELRYSGKEAAILRGFRALYLGVFFNVVIMASVTLAAIKIGGVLLGLNPYETVVIASIVTVAYSALGGLRGVILTDFFQFFIAIIGAIWAANVILDLPQIGGLTGLMENELVIDHTNFLPDFNNPKELIPLFIIPLAVQWWSVWYPGAEPGGGGYIAQRMLSAKNESHAIGATLFFNIAHYALRPWPWIIIALASLIVFPMTSIEGEGLASLQKAFPDVPLNKLGHDMAYPAMLTYLPAGLLGLVVASLIAAFMSTISTHLNWGSSYVVNDFFVRFVNPDASEKDQVWVGRISTVVLMMLAAVLALFLESAMDVFQIMLQIGAGTGLIFILRWFWWRINAYSEISGMVISFIVALVLVGSDTGLESWQELLIGLGVTTVGWVLATLLTPPTDTDKLLSFYKLIRPYGSGWKKLFRNNSGQLDSDLNIEDLPSSGSSLPAEILGMVIGCATVYSALFATGSFLYSNYLLAWILTVIAATGAVGIVLLWKKIRA
ncbi:sodium:solute symporter family protein [Halocola ammonii]